METIEDPSCLLRGPDNIWHAGKLQKIFYPSAGNDAFFRVEDNSFWFRHRTACILELVRQFPPPNLGVIFDVGGG